MSTSSPSQQQLLAISDPAIRALAACGVVRSFPRNTLLITEGDSSDTIYVLLAGAVKVFVSDAGGTEMILANRSAGEFVGELALDGRARSASVMTIEPCTLVLISRAMLRSAVMSDPDFAMTLVDVLIARTRRTTEVAKNLALMDVYKRVTQLLNEICEPRNGLRVSAKKLTQIEIAERVGASRDMVSRILKELVAGGYLSVEQKTYTIHKPFPAHW